MPKTKVKTSQSNIKPREITEEMKTSFLDYSMSVIVARALPDARDGLKPVHRRILYTMDRMGVRHNTAYKKSARIIGDVLGKYHPHGDTAIYDSMVRMAQNFSLRYLLVDGQGNFGSIDGDRPAQMRYTEARMQSLAEQMLKDLDKDTVNFRDNYDGTQREPSVLPAKLPQLLLNGSIGIAVGMATSIPSHNLNEVADASIHLIDNPNAEVDELMQFVKGPDFPTGGQLFDAKALKEAYATGKGSIVVRAKASIQENKGGIFTIIVNEVPWQTNKADIITKIANLVKDKKLEGIRDIRDESGREEDIRVVIELKRDAFPKKVLNKLYQLTELQSSFHFNMLALVDGVQPRVLSLKGLLEQYIGHRREVVTRRTKFELRQAKDRAHILEGLKKALDHIDAIIKTIKASKTKEIAHTNLRKEFKFSSKQTTAILEMKLQTLAGLERKKIEDELEEKKKLIAILEDILKSPQKIMGIIKDEIGEIKEKYGDERRTKIFKQKAGEFSEEDLVANEDTVLTLTRGGYVKRMPSKTYKAQGRGGKGVKGMATKEEDVVDFVSWTMTHNDILFFTNQGRVFQTKVYEIPEASRQAKGQAIQNFLQLGPEEKATAMISLDKDTDASHLVMVTKNGLVKRVDREQFTNVRQSGLIAIKVRDDDELRWVASTGGNAQVMIATARGQAIRFDEKDVRPMGRTAAGVMAVRLKSDDEVIGMGVITKEEQKKKTQILTISENAYGKRSGLKSYKVQNRGGSGIKTAKVSTKTGKLVSMNILNEEDLTDDLLAISENGQVLRTALKNISELGRATQGVRVIRLPKDDIVASVAVI